MEAVETISRIIEKRLSEQIRAGFTGKINFQVVLNQGGIRDFETVTTERSKLGQ